MFVLAIDTAANLCAACILDADADSIVSEASEDIGAGHAERLMDMIGEVLERAGLSYKGLGAVAVSVGPGSFTGVRIGVAAARGLALALTIPSIGVSTLEALALEARQAYPGRAILAAIDAKRGQIYSALYAADGRVLSDPALTTADHARELARSGDAVLTGSAADLVAAGSASCTIASRARTGPIACFARLGVVHAATAAPARPLYLRAADAKPQEGFALPHRGAAA